MEPNTIPPPGQSVQPGVVSDPGTTLPISSYAAGQKSYPLETLEVHRQGQTQTAQTFAPTMRSVPFSRRRATVVSLFITLVVILITGLVSAFFVNRSVPDRSASQLDVPTQDTSLESIIESDLPAELQGLENSLLVSGDIVTRGKLRVASGSFISTFGSADLTANQTITLPDTSGVVCLDANNCNFATQAQLAQIQPAGVVDLDSSDVTDTLPVIRGGTGATALTANGLLIGNGTNPITAVSAAGSGLCLISTGGAPAFQACPGGSASGVSSLNSLTGGLTLQGTANQINVASGGTTITLSTPQDIATTSNVTFNNLQLTGTADVDGVAAIGNGSDLSSGVPDPDGKTALRVTNTFQTDCAFGCVGIASHVEFDAPGNPFFLTAVSSSIHVEDSRALANSSGLTITNPTLGAGATVQQNIGVLVNPQTSGNSNIGIVVGEATGTKQVNLLLGVTPDFSWSNVPSGSYSIYNASTDNNYFAGNLGIGDTTPAHLLTVGNGDLFGVNSSGNVIVTALGTASTDTVVCRNGSNQLATCNSSFATGSGVAFLQGGNNFGGTTAGTLGTTNNGDLNVITNNLTRLTVQADGDVAFDTNTLFVDAVNDLITVGDVSGNFGISLDWTNSSFDDQPSLTFGPNSNKPWMFVVGAAGNSFELYAQGVRNATFGLGGGFWVCCEANGNDPKLNPSNTAAAAAFTFTNDEDTGMYRVNANELGFTTGGANRLTVNSTGGTFAGDIAVNGGDITSTGALNINATSTIALQDSTTIAGDLNVDTNVLSVSATNNSLGINTAAGTSAVVAIATSASPNLEIYGTGTNDLDIASDRDVSIGLDQDNNDGNPRFDILSNASNDTIFSVIEESGKGIAYIQGWLRLGVDAVTINDNGGGTPAALTNYDPFSSYMEVTCNDANGCDVTLNDTNSSQGQTVFIVNISTNTVNFADAAGQQELSANPVALGQYDTLTLIYSDRWIQYATSNNL